MLDDHGEGRYDPPGYYGPRKPTTSCLGVLIRLELLVAFLWLAWRIWR